MNQQEDSGIDWRQISVSGVDTSVWWIAEIADCQTVEQKNGERTEMCIVGQFDGKGGVRGVNP